MMFNDESVDQRVKHRLAELLDERLQSVDEEPLRWLALLPEWTKPLAHACGFPDRDDDLDALLEHTRRLGLCEVRQDRNIAGDENTRFWMPSSVRSSLLERWQMETGMRAEIDAIADRVLAVREVEPAQVSPGVRRWAELAKAELTEAEQSTRQLTGNFLADQVKQSLVERNPGIANEWVFAAEALGEPLGAEMESAATRAQRQVNFYHRQVQDTAYLRYFVERKEQIAELDRLLESEDRWAVHFIGLSGSGKTMLMRYLTSRSERLPRLACSSRIDFDYVDPRYPLESPARLLHELGEGLAVGLKDGTQESLFRSFREAVTEAEAVRLDPAHMPLHALGTPEFKKVVSTFVAFVKELPPPVVLVLDTCEELAKLHPPNEDVPSITATFTILERVHKAAPGVRVVFAGRRWLTPEAADQHSRSKSAAPKSVMCMEKRPYMRMHEVRGFTKSEVIDFLTKVCGEAPQEEMLEAVLKITLDPGRVAGMEDFDEGEQEDRYSPSDVFLLGKWLAADPALSPESLAKGNFDLFVEGRILQRLKENVVAAIPAVTLLERFNAAMIEPVLKGDPASKAAVLNDLIDQEWTHLEGGSDPRDTVIRIDSGLLERLQGYYAGTSELEQAKGALEPHLTSMIEQAPSGATPEGIDASMRLLPDDEAARQFDRMAVRVARKGAWLWAEAVCARLLSPERKPPLEDALAPSVGILYIAALRHRNSSANLGSLWTTIVKQSDGHPDPQEARALKMRGRLGELAAKAANGGFPESEAKAALCDCSLLLAEIATASAVAPALLSAVEALVDAAEERGYPLPPEAVLTCLEILRERFSDDELVLAHILTLEGRTRVIEGDWEGARVAFGEVEQMPLEASPGEPRFIDWVPPDSIRHRVLLELLRFRLADLSEDAALLDRCEEAALEQAGGADAAQLLSLSIQARLATGCLSERRIAQARQYEAAVESYDVIAPAHRAAPPLFASLAEAWLALGAAEPALRLLGEREGVATSRRTDEDAARAAALATVRILRRLRRRDRLALIGNFSADQDDYLRSEGLAAGMLVAGVQPPPSEDRDHAAWRARTLLDANGNEPVLSQGMLLPRISDDSPGTIDDALDQLEAAMIRHRVGARSFRLGWYRRFIERGYSGDFAPAIDDPLARREVRLQLRFSALTKGLGKAAAPIRAERTHLIGQIALEEGELLALRLPEHAVWLLEVAEERLAVAGDAHGAFVAALRAAIAEIHAEQADAAAARRDSILRRYEEMRQVDASLPHPKKLIADGAHAGATDNFWGAWVVRLAAYLIWCDGRPPSQGVADEAPGVDPELTLTPSARPPSAALVRPERILARTGDQLDPLDIWISLHRDGPRPEFEALVEPWPQSSSAELRRRLLHRLGVRREGNAYPLFDAPQTPGAPSMLARELGDRVNVPGLPIRLAITSNLASVNWEWKLAGHLIWSTGWAPHRIPDIWRVPPPGAFSPPRERWSRMIATVCSPHWRPFVAGSAADPARLLVNSRPASDPKGERQHAGTAIAIGSPVITRAGWRLRLDDDELSGPLGDPSQPRRQILHSPDRLAREAPVVVILGRPGGPRLNADRHSADALRGFAHETFLAGAQAVITVPVLPPERAAEAITFLTAEFATYEEVPDPERLLRLAEGLRSIACGRWQVVAGKGEPKDRMRDIRLALDVCLFAPR